MLTSRIYVMHRYLSSLHQVPNEMVRSFVNIPTPARTPRIFGQQLSTCVVLINTRTIKPGLKKSQYILNVRTLFFSFPKCNILSLCCGETVTQCCVQLIKLTAAPSNTVTTLDTERVPKMNLAEWASA